MSERTPPRGFPLGAEASPHPGLLAFAVPYSDGTYPKDRKRDDAPRLLTLEPEEPPARPERPAAIAKASWHWLTSGRRRWASIEKRLGADAMPTVLAIAAAGGVRIECFIVDGAAQFPPFQTIPHPALNATERIAAQEYRDHVNELVERSAALADQLRAEWPGVAASLDDPRTAAIARYWMVCVAEEFLAGLRNPGRRASLQQNPSDSPGEPPPGERAIKQREEIEELFVGLGWEPEALAALGLNRSDSLGLGGPWVLTVGDHEIRSDPLPGPHAFRLTSGPQVSLHAAPRVTRVTVVENRRAAEALCDAWPDEAVIWCGARPGDRVLSLIAGGVRGLEVVVCPDGHLGGVHLVARLLEWVRAPLTVLDVGTADHPEGRLFSLADRDELAVWAQRPDRAGELARACLARGYAVEQEDPIYRVLHRHLGAAG